MNMNHYFDTAHPLRPYTHSMPANPGTVPPANALRGDKPTAKDGFWPCAQEGGWVNMEDHRGRQGWVDGEPVSITVLGPLPGRWREESPEKTDTEKAVERKAKIESALSDIDQQSIRPLRASIDGTATDTDLQKIKELEARARELRQELANAASYAAELS